VVRGWLQVIRNAYERQRASTAVWVILAICTCLSLIALGIATRGLRAALFVLGFGLLQVVSGLWMHRLGPSDRARALHEKHEAMPGDRRWQRRVRGQSRLIQQGDIKPDMFLIGGAMWCIASMIGLLAAALP
jgi:hypothetical protein